MMRSVNLIPIRLQQRRQLRRRRFAWVVSASIYAGALVLACAVWRLAIVAMPPQLAGEIHRVEQETEVRSAELSKLRAALAEHRASMRLGESLADRPDWSNLLALVSRACGPDVVLKRCEISAPSELPAADGRVPVAPAAAPKSPEPARAVLRVQGLGLSQAAVSRFALTMEQTGLFDAIDPSSTRETFDGADVVAFRLDCWLSASIRADAGHAPTPELLRAANDPTEMLR